ncbi:MAG: radical SAM protein [Acidobacteriota bacterium]
MRHYRPERIYLERAVRDSGISRNVISRLPEVPWEVIDSAEDLLEEAKRRNPSIASGKKHLILARHKGQFFKSCPAAQTRGSLRNVCCNYFVINYASNCHMECSYCYLQAYLNMPYMVVYANIDDLLKELAAVLEARPGDSLRIGTGELADSLALDLLTRISVPLVEFFACQENAVLEFKTKSDCVENLLQLDHRRRTVVSWSINPRFIQEHEEHKTASIDERLRAAEKCVLAGYPVAFHLDPLIHYPDWEADYRALVEEIFDRIPPASLSWISLGALRMSPELKDVMKERFPNSRLPLGELVPTADGKMRYFKPTRVEMYQKILGWIQAASANTPVYTCMENSNVWEKVFGTKPATETEVGNSVLSGLAAPLQSWLG